MKKRATACAMAMLALASACSDAGEKANAVGQAAAASSESVVEDARPVLVPAGVDIVPDLQKAGPPWDVAPIWDRTNYTGGSIDLYRRAVSFPMGSITIDRTDYGGIHMVMVGSGVGDRCGDASALGRAYAALSAPLGIPLPNEAQIAQLQQTWAARKGMVEINFPHVTVRAVGGCVGMMVIKAVG